MLTVLAWALDLPRDLRTTQITALRIQARCPQSECEPPQDTRATAASTSKQNCPCGSTLRLQVHGPCLQPTLTSWEVFGNWLSSCLSCLLSNRANDISLSAERILWISVYEGLLFLESSKPPVGENMQKQSLLQPWRQVVKNGGGGWGK